MQRVPLTPGGLKKLEAELENLITIERPAIIEAIAIAREHGDLSENAEYSSAKEKQSFIEGRIAELESKIGAAEVIDPLKQQGGRVVFGATVTLIDVDSDKEVTYALVGTDEADLDRGLLSTSSPIGRGLLGKEAGDEVTVKVPGGERVYEILDVKFQEIKV